MSERQGLRPFLQPAFLVVCSVLLVSALTLNAAVSLLRLHFKKEPVPMRRDFHSLPEVMGQWMQISEDAKLDKEVQDVLGTDKYVYRDYVRLDKAGPDLLAYLQSDGETVTADPELTARFHAAPFSEQVRMVREALIGKTLTERKQAVFEMEFKDPGSAVNVGLTYYTGLVDTVAHIPDRCEIADGYEPSNYTVPTWNVGPPGGPAVPLQVRLIGFEDQTGTNRVSKFVAYFFSTNGHYESDPLGVRRTLEDLTQKFGYYAKVELMTIGKDPAPATAAMTSFLAAAKGPIEQCLPDWRKVTHGH